MHPRPQLTRDRWIDLCGQWEFAYDDADRGRDERWQEDPDGFAGTITVPFPPESKASGVGDPGAHPVVWYRTRFTLPAGEPDERWLLHFGAVDYRAQAWVDGRMVAEHEGGHTPFGADITAALNTGTAEHVLVVRAEDRPGDAGQPRGKQYWGEHPQGIWYHRTTGIWQPVWLEPVNSRHVEALRWTPDAVRGTLGVHARVAGGGPLTLRVRVSLGKEVLADDAYGVTDGTVDREIVLPAARNGEDRARLLWTPEHPALLDVTVTLADGDRVLDRVTSYAGLRDAGVDDRRFLLNGRPYFLRMVLEQGYWPDSHLAAPDEGALRREVELIKSLGFNGARIHQKVEDPRFLYWCDRLGLLVWGEMPSAFVFDAETVTRTAREWAEVVRRDASHPCVVAWVPVNESWGVPAVAREPAQRAHAAALYHLTKALDPTRPALSNDGWEHVESDIWSIHDYAPSGASLRARYATAEAVDRALGDAWPGPKQVLLGRVEGRRPVMITEYGGLSYVPDAGEEWFGYGTVATPEEFLTRYRELTEALLDSPEMAGFCYTQLTDTLQETNGLLRADRSPKLDPAVVRAITARPAASVPGEELAASREDEPVDHGPDEPADDQRRA